MGDAEELKAMRDEIDEVSAPSLPPKVTEAVDRAKGAARSFGSAAGDRYTEATEQVREQPFIAVLVAAAIGYLLGRYIT